VKTYGVWSDPAGGFVALGPTEDEAKQDRDDLIEEGEDEDDLKILVQCPDHEDEPAFGCSYCDGE
jgi:hypothetical protein